MKTLLSYVYETFNRQQSDDSVVNESVQNLFEHDSHKKHEYVDQVWDLLSKAYASQGGLIGSGFKSKEDMMNIPFWKLDIVDGQVLAVFMYKFKQPKPDEQNIRKLVALAISTENRDAGRKKMLNIMKQEFSRSILEVSGLMLDYLSKNFPNELNRYKLTVDQAKDVLPNDDIVAIDKHRYNRRIGGQYHEKTMFGTRHAKY